MSVAERCPCCGQIGVVTRRPSWAFTEKSPEPSAEPATGRDQKMGAPEQGVPSAGGEPRYTLAEVADILEAEAEECRAADGEVSALEGWRDASRWLRHEGTCGGPVYRRPDTLAEVADLIERREYGPGIGEEGLAIARWLRSGGATTRNEP